jgi:hypothetical protein
MRCGITADAQRRTCPQILTSGLVSKSLFYLGSEFLVRRIVFAILLLLGEFAVSTPADAGYLCQRRLSGWLRGANGAAVL